MHKRKLQELNLLDDFMFYTMLSHPKFGEEFSRKILTIIFNREFGKLKVVPQKIYYGSDTDMHGTRLDVYLEESIDEDNLLGEAAVFDLEPELNSKLDNINSLPKRIRFYHSKIDAQSLKAGENYENLKRVVVVMIMPFDPFGFDHMIYTIQNTCVEVPELEYDDGAKTIFLYTKGKSDNVSEELYNLLRYMECTRKENVKSKALEEIHNMVEAVKNEERVTWRYMKIFEREQMLREEGREEGRIEGRVEGHEEGREEERVNTERERKRAEKAEEEVKRLRELLKLNNV